MSRLSKVGVGVREVERALSLVTGVLGVARQKSQTAKSQLGDVLTAGAIVAPMAVAPLLQR